MHSSPRPDSFATLREATGAAGYFDRVNEVVRMFETALDRIHAVELLHEATLRMGAEVSVFASFIRDDNDSCASSRVLVTCDPRWCIEYEEQDCYASDPWVNHALHHTEPIRGCDIALTTQAQRSVVQLAERYGFRSAVIVPTPSSDRLSRLGVLCLGSSIPGYFDAEGYLALKLVARSVAMELHEWWLARLKDELVARSGITMQDLVLLDHVRQGHGTKEIASYLETTEVSVNSRFQRINARLEVPSRNAAVRLASEYRLI